MTPRPHPALLLASLVWLSCAWGRTRPNPSPPPPLTDPFTAPVSSAVIRKAAACQKAEDCGPPAADGTVWQCRLGACTPTSPAAQEPQPAGQPQAAAEPLAPPADAEAAGKDPADRSTLPPGLFAPSPSPAPISPSPVEPPPTAPPPTAPPPPAPAPPPPAAPTPAPAPTTPPPAAPQAG